MPKGTIDEFYTDEKKNCVTNDFRGRLFCRSDCCQLGIKMRPETKRPREISKGVKWFYEPHYRHNRWHEHFRLLSKKTLYCFYHSDVRLYSSAFCEYRSIFSVFSFIFWFYFGSFTKTCFLREPSQRTFPSLFLEIVLSQKYVHCLRLILRFSEKRRWLLGVAKSFMFVSSSRFESSGRKKDNKRAFSDFKRYVRKVRWLRKRKVVVNFSFESREGEGDDCIQRQFNLGLSFPGAHRRGLF